MVHTTVVGMYPIQTLSSNFAEIQMVSCYCPFCVQKNLDRKITQSHTYIARSIASVQCQHNTGDSFLCYTIQRISMSKRKFGEVWQVPCWCDDTAALKNVDAIVADTYGDITDDASLGEQNTNLPGINLDGKQSWEEATDPEMSLLGGIDSWDDSTHEMSEDQQGSIQVPGWELKALNNGTVGKLTEAIQKLKESNPGQKAALEQLERILKSGNNQTPQQCTGNVIGGQEQQQQQQVPANEEKMLKHIASFLIKFYRLQVCEVNGCNQYAFDYQMCRRCQRGANPKAAFPKEREGQDVFKIIDNNEEGEYKTIVQALIQLLLGVQGFDDKEKELLSSEIQNKVIIQSSSQPRKDSCEFSLRDRLPSNLREYDQEHEVTITIWALRCLLALIQTANVYQIIDGFVHFCQSPDNNVKDDKTTASILAATGYFMHYLSRSVAKKINSQAKAMKRNKEASFSKVQSRVPIHGISKACRIALGLDILCTLFKVSLYPRVNEQIPSCFGELAPLLAPTRRNEASSFQKDLWKYLEVMLNKMVIPADTGTFTNIFFELTQFGETNQPQPFLLFFAASIGFFGSTLLLDHVTSSPVMRYLIRQTGKVQQYLLTKDGGVASTTVAKSFDEFALQHSMFTTSLALIAADLFSTSKCHENICIVKEHEDPHKKIFNFSMKHGYNPCADGISPDERMSKFDEIADICLNCWEDHRPYLNPKSTNKLISLVEIMRASTNLLPNENDSIVKDSASLIIVDKIQPPSKVDANNANASPMIQKQSSFEFLKSVIEETLDLDNIVHDDD